MAGGGRHVITATQHIFQVRIKFELSSLHWQFGVVWYPYPQTTDALSVHGANKLVAIVAWLRLKIAVQQTSMSGCFTGVMPRHAIIRIDRWATTSYCIPLFKSNYYYQK